MFQKLNLKIILWSLVVIVFLPLLLSPFLFSPPEFGRGVIFRIIIELIFIIWITLVLSDQKYQPNPSFIFSSSIFRSLAIYISITGFSVIFGIHPFFSLWSEPGRLGGYFSLIHYFLLFIIAGSVIKEKDWEKIWTGTAVAGILVGLFAIEQRFDFFKNFLTAFARPPGPLGNPLILSAWSLLLFFLFLGFVLTQKSLFKKTLFASAASFQFFSILLAQSRSAYLGLVAGLGIFLLFYPAGNKKIKKWLMASSLVIIAIFALGVLLIPSLTKNPEIARIFTFLPSSKNVQAASLVPRLLVWQAGLKGFLDKPILGWGPENFSIAFDKHFNPGLASFGYVETYFDRAHNTLIDTAVSSGILGLAGYLAFFVIVFRQIHKKYRAQNINGENKILLAAVGATLAGYFIQNIFNFDSVSTYIFFFLILAWLEFLLNSKIQNPTPETENSAVKTANSRMPLPLPLSAGILILSALLVFYSIFKFNVNPLLKNWEINRTTNFLKKGSYQLALDNFERLTGQATMFDHFYHALNEGGALYDMAMAIKNTNKEEAIKFLKKAEKRVQDYNYQRPFYVRNYIFLGSINNALYELGETGAEDRAKKFLEKAVEISPKRHQAWLELANIYLISNEQQKVLAIADKLINFNPDIGEAYFIKALSYVRTGNIDEAESQLEIAQSKKLDYFGYPYLGRLAETALTMNNNDFLEKIYLEYSDQYPKNIQPHQLLAALYRNTKQIVKAKKEAQIILELEPRASKQVGDFLNSLEK
ncbi:MAG: O-antigen ligase family protein [Parcubacteria group bacterium]|nr:O-antigen ligase family protein [Parcubacteria group bacterium]